MFLAREAQVKKPSLITVLRANAGRFAFAIVLMTCFNFLSHGTQDLYPTFLREQMKFDPHTTSIIAVVFNIGAICGGITFGAFSERIGRRRAITIAALLVLPAIPFWVYASTPLVLALGGFCLQFAVQGAWGIVPVYLNELSPDAVRGTFPGFAYQIGNLIASYNAVFQTGLAERNHGNFAFGLAIVAGVVAVVLAGLALLGPDTRGTLFMGMKPQTPSA